MLTVRRNHEYPAQIGAAISGETDLYWPSKADEGIAAGAIALNSTALNRPGFVKEFSPRYGMVWRRISAEEINHRRKTTLWK